MRFVGRHTTLQTESFDSSTPIISAALVGPGDLDFESDNSVN